MRTSILTLIWPFRGKAGSSTNDSGYDQQYETKPMSKEPAYGTDGAQFYSASFDQVHYLRVTK